MAELRFILNTSDLDNPVYGLGGGPFTINATGTAILGSLSATATASVAHFATASASLGGLTSTATATVVLPATASAGLGGLVSSATATVVLPATASATLGGLTSSATATVALPATASADLGGLAASAITAIEQNAVATASFGGLVATVDSIPTPPEPEPTPAEPTPSGGRMVYSRQPRKKLEPVVQVIETPIIQPKRRYGVASTSLSAIKAEAESTITFSILEDDAELLLML